MAQPTNTYDSYDQVGIREALNNIISDISPTDCPITSNAKKGKVKNRFFEWQQDELAAPDLGNAQIEGDDYEGLSLTPTVRVGNHVQISAKPVTISETADAVDTAGRAKETGYQLMKKAKELKRDVETITCSNQASLSGNGTTARQTAGLTAWLATNANRGTGGAAGGFNVNTSIVDAATDGTQRQFTEEMLNDVMEQCYINGGQPNLVSVHPTAKRKLSVTLEGIATLERAVNGPGQASVVGATDLYITDFGEVKIAPNRFQRDRDIYMLDMDQISIEYLRPLVQTELAKTGDSTRYLMTQEWGTCVKNEKACGIIADIDPTL